MIRCYDFDNMYWQLVTQFLNIEPIQVGQWQSQDVSEKRGMDVREIFDYSFTWDLPQSRNELAQRVWPNLPWAEDHFLERVSGFPHNPPPSEQWWPFAQQGNKDHKSQGTKFSHTYPERMWPKYAGNASMIHTGIRFAYGDLSDVVHQLFESPYTRQAYLPIWFPEDTGAVHGERVPCTLGYLFYIRDNKLHITYYIRSCDFLRHFRDDVYMAGRLAQWVANELNAPGIKIGEVKVGRLIMHIANLHTFRDDTMKLKNLDKAMRLKYNEKLAGSL